jgi:tRNA dimethylallyltransferase
MHSEAGKTKIVVVYGPTSIGKTSLAIHLADAIAGEVVGADSMQVFRRMDIGTAKPTPEEQARVRHHLVDVADPEEDYDAVRYVADAEAAIADITGRGRVPLVTGGTGFYIKALLHGLFPSPPVDPAERDTLRRRLDAEGPGPLHRELASVDPEAAERLHPNDAYRIVRALEVYQSTGRTMSSFQQAHGFRQSAYRALKIGLHMDREALYNRIDRRVDMMLEAGLEAEVRRLLAEGLGPERKSMQSIGYRHMAEYIAGDLTRDEMAATLKRDTRRYAKRQLTWFRADADTHWMEPADTESATHLVRTFLAS